MFTRRSQETPLMALPLGAPLRPCAAGRVGGRPCPPPAGSSAAPPQVSAAAGLRSAPAVPAGASAAERCRGARRL